MCIHPNVMQEGDRDTVDSLCRFLYFFDFYSLIHSLTYNYLIIRNMTASWVRNRVNSISSSNGTNNNNNNNNEENPLLCQFYENFEKQGNDADIPLGVYDLDELKELGKSRGWCPYFLTRRVFNILNNFFSYLQFDNLFP